MKIPEGDVDTALFAPCGMNCLVCYRHCAHQKPCEGCMKGPGGKPKHCRACQIKACVQERGISYCYECAAYPCKRLKALEKSYRTRYGTSLLENSRLVKAHGLPAFLALEKENNTCPVCGGIRSLHDQACSECRTKLERQRG